MTVFSRPGSVDAPAVGEAPPSLEVPSGHTHLALASLHVLHVFVVPDRHIAQVRPLSVHLRHLELHIM